MHLSFWDNLDSKDLILELPLLTLRGACMAEMASADLFTQLIFCPEVLVIAEAFVQLLPLGLLSRSSSTSSTTTISSAAFLRDRSLLRGQVAKALDKRSLYVLGGWRRGKWAAQELPAGCSPGGRRGHADSGERASPRAIDGGPGRGGRACVRGMVRGGGRRGLIRIAGGGSGYNPEGIVVIDAGGYGLAVALTHRWGGERLLYVL